MDFGRPQQGERVRLRMRNLYILPTRFGWLWLAGTVLLQVVWGSRCRATARCCSAS